MANGGLNMDLDDFKRLRNTNAKLDAIFENTAYQIRRFDKHEKVDKRFFIGFGVVLVILMFGVFGQGAFSWLERLVLVFSP